MVMVRLRDMSLQKRCTFVLIYILEQEHMEIYTKSGLQSNSFFLLFFDNSSVLQLAAQVLDEFDDEEIGVGLLDEKLDKAVAKKLGNRSL